MHRPHGLSTTVSDQLDVIFGRFRLSDLGIGVLYLRVPRRSGRWYVGLTKTGRVRGTTTAPGTQVRGMEHLAALFIRSRGGPGAKYKAWKVLGALAVCMVPVGDRCFSEVESLEGFVISRDQPTANRRGKKTERRQNWEQRLGNARKGPRPPQWRRAPYDPTTSRASNFWE